ncbi:MAG: hypothetical protein ABS934_06870 [Psychrobacillus sp.]
MIKTVKGKIITGTVAVTLLVGAGSAFGASNAGEMLQNWFNTQFGAATEEFDETVGGYQDDKTLVASTQYGALETKATGKIGESQEDSTASATSKIDKDLQEHKAALEKKKVELTNYANAEFTRIYEIEKENIRQIWLEANRKAERDMEAHTIAEGSAALDTLNAELEAATTAALTELEAAIEASKSGLQATIDNHVDTKTDDLKGKIDKELADFTIWTQMMTNFMIQTQTDAIEAAAKDLETAALTSMQDLVNGINE